MSAHQARSWMAAWCALMLAPAGLAGQSHSVHPIEDLTFGQVLPGVSKTVSPNDAANRAQFEIRGSGIFTLQMVLPTHMVSAQGKQMPISFSSTDGLIRWRRFGIQYNYDVTRPYTLWLLSLADGADVYVGGRANPTASQPPGNYTASLVLIVSNAGS
jgi:hypothetical protein